MKSFRDIKRRARGDVHRHMRVPALYIESVGAKPRRVMVRPHTQFSALGDMKGTSFSYAERIEFTPTCIFWRDELPEPRRNAIITVQEGEAYYLDTVLPPDGQTIKVNLVPILGAELEALNLPYLELD